MIPLICAICALVLAVIFFASFPFIKRNAVKRNFTKICNNKVKNISKRNKLDYYTNIDLVNFNGEHVKIDQIIYGQKYVYLIKNHTYFGIISGKAEDNSWIHLNLIKKEAEYINNFLLEGKERISQFSQISKLDKSLLIDVELVNNECDVRLNKVSNDNCYLLKHYKLAKFIKKLEQTNVGVINKEQLKIVEKEIKERNE